LPNRDRSAFDRVGASIKSSLFQHLERIGVELIGALPASRQQTFLFQKTFGFVACQHTERASRKRPAARA
jgi:predicted permease